MSILPQVVEAMQTVLSTKADIIAKESHFVKRERTLSGSNFVQTLVFGWLANPCSSLEELTQTSAALEVSISPQGLDQRFTPEAASFLKQLLDEAVCTLIAAEPVAIPVLQRFNGIYIQDSSIIRLPDELSEIWTGCGGTSPKNTSSSVKLQVRWDFSAGGITGPSLQSGRENDKSSPLMDEPLPSGALWMADLGYFSLTLLADFSSEEVYWLTRLKSNCVLYDKAAKTVQKHAINLAIALASGCVQRLSEALQIIQRCLAKGCRINKRKTKPSTYQLLLGTRIR
jgi:hypothetical protein